MDAYIGLKTVYVSVLFMYSLYLGLDEDCLQHDGTLIYLHDGLEEFIPSFFLRMHCLLF